MTEEFDRVSRPYEDWVRQWQSGVWLTHDQTVPAEFRYAAAEALIAEARRHLTETDSYRASIDHADTIRDPGRAGEAIDMLTGAIKFFNPADYPKDRATALHHRARRLRGAGENSLAFETISPALLSIRSYNQKRLQAKERFDPEQIWIELDYAAIAALNGYKMPAREVALRAVRSILRFRSQVAREESRSVTRDLINLVVHHERERVIQRDHLGRAAILFTFAGNPKRSGTTRMAFGITE